MFWNQNIRHQVNYIKMNQKAKSTLFCCFLMLIFSIIRIIIIQLSNSVMTKLVCSFIICSQSWSYISWFSCTTPVWQLMRSKPRFVRSTSDDPLSRSAALARQNSWLALNARNRWNIRKVVLRFQTSSPDDLTVCRTKTLPPWLLVQNLWLCTRRMNVASGLVCQLASKSCFAHKDHLRLRNKCKWSIELCFCFCSLWSLCVRCQSINQIRLETNYELLQQ